MQSSEKRKCCSRQIAHSTQRTISRLYVDVDGRHVLFVKALTQRALNDKQTQHHILLEYTRYTEILGNYDPTGAKNL